MDDLIAARGEVHDAKPDGWVVGRTMELRPGEWVLFAYDPRTARRGVVHRRRWPRRYDPVCWSRR